LLTEARGDLLGCTHGSQLKLAGYLGQPLVSTVRASGPNRCIAASSSGPRPQRRERHAWPRARPRSRPGRAGGGRSDDHPACRIRANTLISALPRQLLDLRAEIKQLDKLVAARFSDHLHAERITSAPSFGPILGAQLLAATGGDLTAAFGNSARLTETPLRSAAAAC